jgi:imidazoleglycerol-phosphate dehydratase
MARTSSVKRDTNETKVHIILSLDGGELENVPQIKGERTNHHAFQSSKAQYVDIDTGIGFLDHMIHQLAKHGGWSLYVKCRGDLHSKWHLERPPQIRSKQRS